VCYYCAIGGCLSAPGAGPVMADVAADAASGAAASASAAPSGPADPQLVLEGKEAITKLPFFADLGLGEDSSFLAVLGSCV